MTISAIRPYGLNQPYTPRFGSDYGPGFYDALEAGLMSPVADSYEANKTETLELNGHEVTLEYANRLHPNGPLVSINYGPMDTFTKHPPKGKWPGTVIVDSTQSNPVHAFSIDLRKHPDMQGWERRVTTDWKPIAVAQYREPTLAPTRKMKIKMFFSEKYAKEIETLRKDILAEMIVQEREHAIRIARDLLSREAMFHRLRDPEFLERFRTRRQRAQKRAEGED